MSSRLRVVGVVLRTLNICGVAAASPRPRGCGRRVTTPTARRRGVTEMASPDHGAPAAVTINTTWVEVSTAA